MAGPYRMKRVQEPAPYRWQRQQQATGTTKAAAGASPVQRAQPVDNAKALRMANVRHIIEKEGGNWTGRVCLGQVLSIADDVTQIVGGGLYKKLAEATKRIAELEKQVTGMQAKVDHHEKHALIFRGDWQAAQEYSAGCVVRHRGALFTALKTILPGKGEPGRSGSGWDHII